MNFVAAALLIHLGSARRAFWMPEKGEVLLRGVGTLRHYFPPNASVHSNDMIDIIINTDNDNSNTTKHNPISVRMLLAMLDGYHYRHIFGPGARGGAACLTLLVYRRFSSKVAHDMANDGDP